MLQFSEYQAGENAVQYLSVLNKIDCSKFREMLPIFVQESRIFSKKSKGLENFKILETWHWNK